jgi:hypothetical protein
MLVNLSQQETGQVATRAGVLNDASCVENRVWVGVLSGGSSQGSMSMSTSARLYRRAESVLPTPGGP